MSMGHSLPAVVTFPGLHEGVPCVRAPAGPAHHQPGTGGTGQSVSGVTGGHMAHSLHPAPPTSSCSQQLGHPLCAKYVDIDIYV